MKKIVFFSEETLFSGNIKCGRAEVVDSLALSLVNDYEVFVVCQEGESTPSRHVIDFEILDEDIYYARAMNINYYIIKSQAWHVRSAEVVDRLKSDVLHNFCEPSLISRLTTRPAVTVFTFDDLAFLEDKLEWLDDYDFVTTFSNGYREYILSQNGPVVDKLKTMNFARVSCGIASEVFNPATGLFLKAPYSIEKIGEKQISKKQLLDRVGQVKDCPIFLTMGNISHRKGADLIIKAARLINQKGGKLVIFGSAPQQYHETLKCLQRESVIFYESKVPPTHVIPILAGADFYLQPSLMESGGLMPLTASRYGAVPIVTLNGGFADSFTTENSVLVMENDIESAIEQAFNLYDNYLEFIEKQKICMQQDFGWNIRKLDFIRLYESKGESNETSGDNS